LAIRTKHLSSIGGPALVKAPLQRYDVLSLRGIANQAEGLIRDTRRSIHAQDQLIEEIVALISIRAHSSLSNCFGVLTLISNEALP